MEHNTHYLQILKTARYYTNNPDSSKISNVLFVLHGYAQLAGDFIQEFEDLNNDNTLIIAPEGLSRFYFRNKIGASWMTKEDRDNETKDYISYLEKLFDEISKNFYIRNKKVNVLGFSQGVHTALRWILGSKNDFDKLILYSSGIPADIDFGKLRIKSNDTGIYYARGSHDDIIEKEDFKTSLENLKEKRIRFNEIVFEGKHTVDKESLKLILSE